MGALVEIIKDYFNTRGLVWPNFDNAMKFAQTELAEVYEIDLARNTWVRNNPQDKPEFDKEELAKELGDAIMMLIVAGIAEGVDPVDALLEKIGKKVDKEYGINAGMLDAKGVYTYIRTYEIKQINTEYRPGTFFSTPEKDKAYFQSKIEFGNNWD